MNQSTFEHINQNRWDKFRKLLETLESTSNFSLDTLANFDGFPEQYRMLCNHYGLAKARHYSPTLVDMLHDLVLRGHRQLYTKKHNIFWAGLHFIAKDFPRIIRQYALSFWIAFFLFFGPAVGVGIATYHNPTLIYSILSESQVINMESMYDPTNKKIGRSSERNSETDFAMFGYYIFNNISIGFRTFAGGIIFGAGSLLLLVFNGIMIGGVAGHLSHPPYMSIFWQFVCGHGAFELIAIVISGAAGLLLGDSLLRPGPYRRLESLKTRAPDALKLVIGAALMLFVAAFIEAFWSSSKLPQYVKFTVAGCNWTFVALYLLFAGKSR